MLERLTDRLTAFEEAPCRFDPPCSSARLLDAQPDVRQALLPEHLPRNDLCNVREVRSNPIRARSAEPTVSVEDENRVPLLCHEIHLKRRTEQRSRSSGTGRVREDPA